MRYDVAVVGCGPAGACALRRAVELGLRAIGLERHRMPRRKPCAGVLYPRVLEEFEVPEHVVEAKLREVRLVAPSGKVAVMRLDPPGAIVDRASFDKHLLDRAVNEGADVIEGARAVKVEVDEHGCRVVVEGGLIIEASYVIGADGAYSTVARSLGRAWSLDDGALAVQAVLRGPPPDLIGAFEVYYDPSKTPRGWRWAAGGCRWAVVGAGVPASMRGACSLLRRLVDELARSRLRGAEVAYLEAHMIPIAGPRPERLATDRALLVGDAGGFVRSDTGEGVYYAMHSGEAAAEAIYDALNRGLGLAEAFLRRLEDRGLLQLLEASTEVHEALRSVEGAERFVERVVKLCGA